MTQRLYATADPAAGQRDGYGHGVVNPYRALTERLDRTAPLPAEAIADPVADPRARDRHWRADGRLAALVALGMSGLALLAPLAAAVGARGRRRGWRPARRGVVRE